MDPDPLSVVIYVLCSGFATLCRAWGAKGIKPESFLPDSLKPKEEVFSPKQAAIFAASVLGKPTNRSD